MSTAVEVTYSSSIEERYMVKFCNHSILTTLTSTASAVDEWLFEIVRVYDQITIVGLDTEWCLPPLPTKSNKNEGKKDEKYGPIAILQLCVGTHCLIYQLIHAEAISKSLREFLADHRLKFVGVGVDGDASKLFNDYGLSVGCTVDLPAVAATKLKEKELKHAGLKKLAGIVLQVEMEKPKNITLSCWNLKVLDLKQIHYACVDAFVSFEIGKCLLM